MFVHNRAFHDCRRSIHTVGSIIASTHADRHTSRLDFFTDSAFANQTASTTDEVDSDSLYDLLPHRPETTTTTSHSHSVESSKRSIVDVRLVVHLSMTISIIDCSLLFLEAKRVSSSIHSYNRYLSTRAQYPVYMTQKTFFQMFFTPDNGQWSKFESYLVPSLLVRQFIRTISQVNHPTVTHA
jgi:hypothetical protein